MTAGPRLAWIDGEPAVSGLLLDRGLHYGDGLFETVIVRAGRPRFLALHARRLAEGCRRLGLAGDDAAGLLAGSCARVGGADGVLKLILTRGDAVARGYGTTGTERPRAISLWYPDPPAPRGPVRAAEPCETVTLASRWGENPQLAGLKHLNRLEQVLSRRELAAAGAAEGVVGGAGGNVCSGTTCNVFVRIDRRWITPRIDRCGIAGVMRAVVLREAAASALPVEEADIPLARLGEADALFFTNVRTGIRFATSLDGRGLRQDAAIAALAERIDALAD